MLNKKIEEKIEKLLSELSMEEKIGQLNQRFLNVNIENEEMTEKLIEEGKIGSLIVASSFQTGNDSGNKSINTGLLTRLQRHAVENSPHHIPLLFGRDVIHGHHTVYPVALAAAASFDMPLVRRCYERTAIEAACDGINWTFSPMIDLSRDPRWGRMVEGPGEDPCLGAKFAEAVVKGFQGDFLSENSLLAACAKHFLGYGAACGGRDYQACEISDYTLRNMYLKAFKGAVDAGVATVMNSFSEVSGHATSSSKYLITEILKNELGFNGFVISDWGAVEQIIRQGIAKDKKECAELCMNAGLDMDMVDECYSNYLKNLVDESRVSVETINESVRRVLRVKFTLGLFEKPYAPAIPYDKNEHRKLAREMATDSIVLLKNRNNILPLKSDAKIAFVGPFTDEKRALMGTWVLDGREDETISIKEGIQNVAPDASIFEVPLNCADLMQGVIKKADIIVLALGESQELTGEGRSIANIELPSDQKALIERAHTFGKPVVGILNFARPRAFSDEVEFLDAIVYAWHCGSESGNAIADILFGRVCPSAKLPVTIPRSTGQIPMYYNHQPSGKWADGYYDDLYGNSRNYEDIHSTPLYEFGYGLSYADFEYKDLKISHEKISLEDLMDGEKVTVSVTVQNTGKINAKEIVQCYVRDPLATMVRPVKELKGFEKVLIESGKSKVITFMLGFDELGFYNQNGKYVVEKGLFEIYVGKSSCAKEFKGKIHSVTVT